MKKFIYVLAAMVLSMGAADAHDLITKKNGEDIKAKVLEVTPDEVKYKLYDEPNGVTYTTRKSELLIISYESGRNEVFNQQSTSYLYYTDREPLENLRQNMRYKELKRLYNHKEYEAALADRYSPGWTGVASAVIPGLGECINGEWGRGLGKFFGNLALVTTANVFVQKSYVDAYPTWQADIVVGAVCYVAALGLDIWSIVDAVRIAKVKNMYEQDLKKTYAVDVDLYPSVDYIQLASGVQPTTGFTFAVRF
jgi:hypothetical protein